MPLRRELNEVWGTMCESEPIRRAAVLTVPVEGSREILSK